MEMADDAGTGNTWPVKTDSKKSWVSVHLGSACMTPLLLLLPAQQKIVQHAYQQAGSLLCSQPGGRHWEDQSAESKKVNTEEHSMVRK